MVFHLAVGSCSASTFARVYTLELEAGLVAGAVIVGGTFGVAPAVGITLVEFRTRANSTMVPHITVSTLSTGITARVHTNVVPAAHTGAAAICITDTFRLTSGKRVSDVVLDARADSAVIAHLAVGVATAGGWVAQLLRAEYSAPSEGISYIASWAGADGLMVPDDALSSLAADVSLAWVDTFQALAGEVTWAVVCLDTLSTTAVGEWIAFIANRAGADGPVSANGTVSIGSAGRRSAGVEGWGGRSYTADRFVPGAAGVRVATVVAWAPAVSAVVSGITLSIDSTCSLHAHAHALGCSASVVVGAVVISRALGLASIDGVAIGHEVSEAPTESNTSGARFTSGVGTAWRGTARICRRAVDEGTIDEGTVNERALHKR